MYSSIRGIATNLAVLYATVGAATATGGAIAIGASFLPFTQTVGNAVAFALTSGYKVMTSTMSMLFDVDKFSLTALQSFGAVIASVVFGMGIMLASMCPLSLFFILVWCDWLVARCGRSDGSSAFGCIGADTSRRTRFVGEIGAGCHVAFKYFYSACHHDHRVLVGHYNR